MQPLKGLTVVTLEHAIAAPFATRQLADLGARVIKIERPGTGDFARGYDERVRGLAAHFVWTNRSKESLTLDVKHPFYPYGPFPAGDGATVMLGLQNEREWVSFCDKVLLQPALARDARFAGNPKRVAARVALRQIIVDAFQPLTAAEVVARLEAAQIANARVNTMHDVWEHPQLKARGRWREVGSPAGMLPAMLPPGTWNEGPRMDPVPALGEHTDAILAELGFDAAGMAALHAAEAV